MDRYLRLLRRRDYTLLWTGATVSALGDGMSFVALLWLALELGSDATTVGWIAAAYTAPVLVGGLAAGLVLDRWDRRLVLIADNIVRGVLIATVPAAWAIGGVTPGHLFLVAAVYGLLFMVSLAGIPSLVPSLVPDEELTTANAMESLAYGIGGLAGPALAGAVIALAGAPAVLAIDALSYAVFAGCLLLMRSPGAAAAPADGDGQPVPAAAGAPAGTGLGPALRFIVGAPAVIAITLIYMAVNVGEGMFIVLAPVYAREVLDGGPATYGALASAFTGGALVGALLVGAVAWRWPLGRSIAAAVVATGGVFGLMLATPPLPAAMVILFTTGLCASSLTAWAQTVRMRLIPPELRGRVFAMLRTLMQGTTPVGAVLGGVLLARGEVTGVIAAIALVIAVPGAIGFVSPALGRAATGEAR